jgi:hypothetical protein
MPIGLTRKLDHAVLNVQAGPAHFSEIEKDRLIRLTTTLAPLGAVTI